MTTVSELEGCVLGLVHTRGPVTAYAIRRVFLDSPSPHWSGSAGAIYPLIRRLEKAGLVHSSAHATGSRRSLLYRLTRAGREALRRWIGPPIPDRVVAVPVDALRTRLGFLSVLPRTRRIALVKEARARLRQTARAAEREYGLAREDPDPHRCLMARGALLMLRARTQWLDEVIASMKEGHRR